MKAHLLRPLTTAVIAVVFLLGSGASAHVIGDEEHDGVPAHYDPSARPPLALWLAQAGPDAQSGVNGLGHPPLAASVFAPFTPKVATHWDDWFFYVESDGMPDHRMMTGITAWQQQVPLPQPYRGANAWRFPLKPVPATNPVSAKTHFFRGAIAIAANGVPIFNPIKNDGLTDTFLAGELDEFGGHAGRADDYHYHTAPVHLQAIIGAGRPVAYALDGYPIYGFKEPDGSAAAGLDAFNGHTTAELGYHYHATKGYPYLNGGFHGEVVERDGQVDPQPNAQGLREALTPLRGARITGFTGQGGTNFSLKYQFAGATRSIDYIVLPDNSVRFAFIDGNGTTTTEVYTPRRSGGGDRPPPDPEGPSDDRRGRPGRDRSSPPPDGAGASTASPLILQAKHSGRFVLRSPAVKKGDALPAEFTGDGAGATLPLEWTGAPEGTKSYALVMDHLAPGNDMKCYWTLWDIPETVTGLPKDVKGVGKTGSGFKGRPGYEPPHSQGPGLKTYTVHLYALSEAPTLAQPQTAVTRDVLLNAIKDTILDSAELRVTYTKPGNGSTNMKETSRP